MAQTLLIAGWGSPLQEVFPGFCEIFDQRKITSMVNWCENLCIMAECEPKNQDCLQKNVCTGLYDVLKAVEKTFQTYVSKKYQSFKTPSGYTPS